MHALIKMNVRALWASILYYVIKKTCCHLPHAAGLHASTCLSVTLPAPPRQCKERWRMATGTSTPRAASSLWILEMASAAGAQGRPTKARRVVRPRPRRRWHELSAGVGSEREVEDQGSCRRLQGGCRRHLWKIWTWEQRRLGKVWEKRCGNEWTRGFWAAADCLVDPHGPQAYMWYILFLFYFLCFMFYFSF